MENSGKTYLWGAVSVLAAFLIGALVSGLLVKGHFKAILDDFSPKVDTLYYFDPKLGYYVGLGIQWNF